MPEGLRLSGNCQSSDSEPLAPGDPGRMELRPSPTDETVIVIHGTFAKPGIEGGASWWERRGAFCRQLDRALEEYGSTARCWAHDGECFRWSGENSVAARGKAASELRAYNHRLIRQGWRCHVVAHSHGGTVLVEALRDIPCRDKTAHQSPAFCGTPRDGAFPKIP
jgi:hypothetical protein